MKLNNKNKTKHDTLPEWERLFVNHVSKLIQQGRLLTEAFVLTLDQGLTFDADTEPDFVFSAIALQTGHSVRVLEQAYNFARGLGERHWYTGYDYT